MTKDEKESILEEVRHLVKNGSYIWVFPKKIEDIIGAFYCRRCGKFEIFDRVAHPEDRLCEECIAKKMDQEVPMEKEYSCKNCGTEFSSEEDIPQGEALCRVCRNDSFEKKEVLCQR